MGQSQTKIPAIQKIHFAMGLIVLAFALSTFFMESGAYLFSYLFGLSLGLLLILLAIEKTIKQYYEERTLGDFGKLIETLKRGEQVTMLINYPIILTALFFFFGTDFCIKSLDLIISNKGTLNIPINETVQVSQYLTGVYFWIVTLVTSMTIHTVVIFLVRKYSD